jgi:hypothetical protein
MLFVDYIKFDLQSFECYIFFIFNLLIAIYILLLFSQLYFLKFDII